MSVDKVVGQVITLSVDVETVHRAHDEYVKTKTELVATVEELAGALNAIEKNMSFIRARGGK